MGIRISWRSRPRNVEYPWPLRTKTTTIAELKTDYGNSGPLTNLIGPLSLEAVCEFVYRVTELELSGELEFQDNNGNWIPFSDTQTYTLADGDPVTEADQFAKSNCNESLPSGNVQSIAFLNSSLSGLYQAQAINSEIEGTETDVDIFEDENGDFWLSGLIDFELDDGILVFSLTTRYPNSGSYEEFTADLILHSGTYQITAVGVSAGEQMRNLSLTVTATGWFPFATTTGLDAWNTTTGAPANGGPGA